MDDVTLWQTIDQEEKRIRLFEGLASRAATVQLEADGVSVTTTARRRDEAGLHVQRPSMDPVPFVPGRAVNARFSIDEDDYFFRCVPSFQGTLALLPFPAEIFRLQRRKDFRLTVPAAFPAFFEVTGRANGRVPVRLKLLDLSGTGIGFDSPADEVFQIGEEVSGELILGSRPSVRLQGAVRFARAVGGRQQIGLEIERERMANADALQTAIAFFRVDVFTDSRKDK